MKTTVHYLKFGIGVLILAAALLLASCEKDAMVGKLRVHYTDVPDYIRIYPMNAAGKSLPIRSFSVSDGNLPYLKKVLTCELNMGNYYLEASNSLDVGFQIKPDETTNIHLQ